MPRLSYDRGALEMVAPSLPHEEDALVIGRVVEIVAAILDVPIRRLGSTTYRRPDLERGFEPDASFYVQNEARMRGRRQIDLSVDPPPDLVIEIDVTSPSLPRPPIYAAMGVPEIWRYGAEAGRVSVLVLGADGHEETATSGALPPVTGEVLSRFVAESRGLPRTAWLRAVRGWVRGTTG